MLGGARPPIFGGKGEAEAPCPRNQKLGDVEGADSHLPTSSPSAIGDLYPAKSFSCILEAPDGLSWNLLVPSSVWWDGPLCPPPLKPPICETVEAVVVR